MCSFIFTNKAVNDLEYVNEFTKYRGPDHTSEIHNGPYTFVHNLLSITGEFTPQPTISPDNGIYCLFNGEIYNFQDFGKFANDSRCLIPLYQNYGTHFISKLDGEFSIVLIDFNNNLAILATDAFSTKPLWVSTDGKWFGAASYRSPLSRLGFKYIEKVSANTIKVYQLDSWKLKHIQSVNKFDIQNQHKKDFNDWNNAFRESIYKRAMLNVREKVFIGLSSGFDSGAISCELLNQKIPFKAYSIQGNENREVLFQRYARLSNIAEIEPIRITSEQRALAHSYIVKNVENFKYRIYSMSSNYNEFNLSIHDDHGANSLSHVAGCAKRDGRKIYLSGQGSDEIFSDYGFGGKKIYPHSNFGGLFPKNLQQIFPWPSFYESSQVSYLTKEESVAGSYGLEARYPFLDPKVIQEFLWLDYDLKNKWYKSVLYNYFKENNFPFSPNEKIGF